MDSVQRLQLILFFYIWMAIVDGLIRRKDNRELKEVYWKEVQTRLRFEYQEGKRKKNDNKRTETKKECVEVIIIGVIIYSDLGIEYRSFLFNPFRLKLGRSILLTKRLTFLLI